MKTDTADKILKFIDSRGRAATKEIVDHLSISRQAAARQLKKLLEQEKIYKIGRPPKVFYAILEQKTSKVEYFVSAQAKKIIDAHFLNIGPVGEMKKGWEGFIDWCLKRKQDIKRAAADYVSIIKKYKAVRKNGLLDGMRKLKKTFPDVYLDQLFYLEFYAIEHFGKTKLGQLLLYAKQSQNKAMIRDLAEATQPKVRQLIKQYKIKAVGFVPPTVKREVQFMKELEKNLALALSKIRIVKVKTPVIIPQKTLSKLEDRIENAKRTFVVEDQPSYRNVLLIDDAVGSGATLNEIAKQIKQKHIAQKIIGLVITGSLKGFDVISEV